MRLLAASLAGFVLQAGCCGSSARRVLVSRPPPDLPAGEAPKIVLTSQGGQPMVAFLFADIRFVPADPHCSGDVEVHRVGGLLVDALSGAVVDSLRFEKAGYDPLQWQNLALPRLRGAAWFYSPQQEPRLVVHMPSDQGWVPEAQDSLILVTRDEGGQRVVEGARPVGDLRSTPQGPVLLRRNLDAQSTYTVEGWLPNGQRRWTLEFPVGVLPCTTAGYQPSLPTASGAILEAVPEGHYAQTVRQVSYTCSDPQAPEQTESVTTTQAITLDTSTGQVVGPVRDLSSDSLLSQALMSDGTGAVQLQDNSWQIYDTASGQPLGTIPVHNQLVGWGNEWLAFDTLGRPVVRYSREGTEVGRGRLPDMPTSTNPHANVLVDLMAIDDQTLVVLAQEREERTTRWDDVMPDVCVAKVARDFSLIERACFNQTQYASMVDSR